MKRVKKNLLKIIECITRIEVERNLRENPPFCSGIYHQPKRPKKS